MTDGAVAQVKHRFRTTAQTLYGMAEDLPSGYSDLGAAVGEFYDEIDTGLSPFTASWQATLGLCEDEARLIAGNTNNLWVDLARLDRGAP